MKRLSDSERVAITFKPRDISSRQSSGRGSVFTRCLQALRDGLDGRERIVQLVPKHAHQPLPGLQFFFAQGRVSDR